jgi:hypothetical protein
MIAHLVVWTWQSSVTEEQVTALTTALRQLTAPMRNLVAYECGPALGVRQGGDFGVLAVVENAAALEQYLDDPGHLEVARDVLAPMTATRTAVQIELTHPLLRGLGAAR